MSFMGNWVRKFSVLMGAAVLLGLLWIYPALVQAEDTTTPAPSGGTTCGDAISCLQAISANTYGALQALNNLPTYLTNASQYILNWTAADKSTSTQTLQADFTTTGNQFISNSNFVNSSANLVQLMADTLGVPVTQFTKPEGSPAILNTLSNVNDLAYSTVLNIPPVNAKGAPVSAYNYIKNASGANLKHVIPLNDAIWQGKQTDKTRYRNYFNSITAVTSYNTYVLDSLVAENASGNLLSPTQLDLVSNATNGTWLAAIATENLGVVLRQLLMFLSQTYVLQTQLLQTQKQMLTAQVMTNSLLIAVNQMSESVMAAKAQNIPIT